MFMMMMMMMVNITHFRSDTIKVLFSYYSSTQKSIDYVYNVIDT